VARSPLALALVLGAAALAACSSAGARPRRPLQVPNAVAGGTRGGGRPEAPSLERMREDEEFERQRKLAAKDEERKREEAKAEALWRSAQALETKDREDAADAYQELGVDYPNHPSVHEAHYREAVLRFQEGDWNGTQRALEAYMRVAPVNPHLPEVERMLYEAGTRILVNARGLQGVFRSKKRGFDALNFVADHFPAGRYPDDALIALGDEYVHEGDYETAALQYQELLLRFPDSEWSFMARLKLGDAQLARDQGAAYHAGYVDLDPRGRTDDAYKQGRPVRSCVASALEQYEAFLERVEVDPARRVEYAPHVAYARGRAVECRRRLAEKDRRTAAWYGGEAGRMYEESARRIEAGGSFSRTGGANGGAVPLPSAPPPRPVVGPAAPPPVVVPPSPPVVEPLPTPKPTLPPPPPPLAPPVSPAEEPTAPRPAPPPRPEAAPVAPPPAPPASAVGVVSPVPTDAAGRPLPRRVRAVGAPAR
jgi:TolA-binding protein